MPAWTPRMADAGRWVLLVTLAVLPARALLEELAPALESPLRWFDELALLAALACAVMARLGGLRRRAEGERVLVGVACAFVVACLSSALINGTGWTFFVFGTADYLKGFGFLWAASVLDAPALRNRVRKLLVALAAVVIAYQLIDFVLQNGFQIGSVFDSPPHLRDVFQLTLRRPHGLLGHPNTTGLFLSLGLIVALTVGRASWRGVSLHYLAAVLSLSRLIFAATFVVLLPLCGKRRWLVIPCLCSALFLGDSFRVTVGEYSQERTTRGKPVYDSSTPWHYRTFSTQIAVRVFRDHALVGVGPGRFGGVVSLAFGSPVYDDYPFPPRHEPMLRQVRGLDTFYPQLLAELGAIGALAFAGLGGALLWLLGRRSRRGDSDAPWATAGALAVLVVPVYCLGAGLNMAEYLVPAMVLAGVGLSCSPPLTPGGEPG